jgi:hypothetical protein
LDVPFAYTVVPIVATFAALLFYALAGWVWLRMGAELGTLVALARERLAFEGRWRLLAAQIVVAGASTAYVVLNDPVGPEFLRDHSGFFQTAAQVQAGIIVAFALTQYGDDVAARAVRPAVALAVLLGSLGLLSSVAGTTPLLPDDLVLVVFAVAIAGGTSSLLSLVLVSWRLLR